MMKKRYAMALVLTVGGLHSIEAAYSKQSAADVVAIWQDYDPLTGQTITKASRPVEESLDQAVVLSQETKTAEVEPPISINNAVAITRRGLPLHLWIGADRATGLSALYATMMDASGKWRQPEKISAWNEDLMKLHQVVVGESGQVTVVWSCRMTGVTGLTQRASTISFNGHWSQPVTLSH